jgi:hypothetical protein
MALHIVVGMRTISAAEEEHLLYLGRDGVKALEAAARAKDSGEYEKGRIKRQVIYTWIPCATVPDQSKAISAETADQARAKSKRPTPAPATA